MSTPSQVFSQIRTQANEPVAAFWSDAEIYSHMSTGQTILAQSIGCTEDSTTFLTTNGTREYSVPTNVGTVVRLEWNSMRLKGIDLNQLDDVEGQAYGGIKPTGLPEYYYRWGNTIGFSPIPNADQTASLHYYATCADVTNTSTGWSIPDKYGSYVGHYALWQMFTKDQQLNEEAALYKKQWEDEIELARHDWIKTKYRDRQPTVAAIDSINSMWGGRTVANVFVE